LQERLIEEWNNIKHKIINTIEQWHKPGELVCKPKADTVYETLLR